MGRAVLYFHTLRYLKPVQIWRRIVFRLHRPVPDLSEAPSLRKPACNWQTPAARHPSMSGPSRFRFLNKVGELSGADSWNSSRFSKLWLYNLHYFDDLNATRAHERSSWHITLIEKWVRENPPGQGAGWEPYPISLRIINWIKWALAGNRLDDIALHSLAIQTRYLNKRLEYHLLGNHLLVNAKALLFAGCFFQGKEADEWLCKGMSILESEISEQILPDGGQFELSTMYHALALEDLLDITNLIKEYPEAIHEKWYLLITKIYHSIDKMRDWLVVMSHPDNEIGLFNDAAINIAPSPSELERYAVELGFQSIEKNTDKITCLKDSGYIRVELGHMITLLDVAKIGPDYLPGHAHADTLTFETSLFGQRLIVNSGTSVYGSDAERQRQRGTAAHNTVCIDGENSSEVWSGFRVARRAYPGIPVLEKTTGTLAISCSHDGYKRLAGKCTHSRKWSFEDTSFTVTDIITGKFGKAIANFHIHPDISIYPKHDSLDTYELTMRSGHKVNIIIRGADSSKIRHSTWHPEFGLSQGNVRIEVSFSSSMISTAVNW